MSSTRPRSSITTPMKKSPSILLCPSRPHATRPILMRPPSITSTSTYSPSTPFVTSFSSSDFNADCEYHEFEFERSTSCTTANVVSPVVVSKVSTLTVKVCNKTGIGYGMTPRSMPTPTSPEAEDSGMESEADVAAAAEPILEEANVEGSHYAVSSRKNQGGGRRKGKPIEDTHKVMKMIINVVHPPAVAPVLAPAPAVDLDAQAEDVSFFGVFDGHGGSKAADFAAENLGKHIVGALVRAIEDDQLQLAANDQVSIINKTNLLNKKNLEHAVKSGYLRTDEEFLKQGVSSGTTCVTALIIDGKLVVSNAGDSRAVISKRSGEAEALTCDHKVAREDELERIEKLSGLVKKSGGLMRIGRLCVSRGIGDSDLKEFITPEPDTIVVEITSDYEFLILATDGLWDVVTNQEAVDIARPFFCCCIDDGGARGSPLAACQKLVDVAVARNSRDDITVMIVQLQHFNKKASV